MPEAICLATRDRSWSNPELFPHQDNTDPSLLGIYQVAK